MKPSPFNIFLSSGRDDTELLLNTLSGTACEIFKSDANAIRTGGEISSETEAALKSMSSITESPEAQCKLVFSAFREEQLNTRELTIVLPLTTKCNMKCTYCYQVLHGDFSGSNSVNIPSWTTDAIDIVAKFVRRELAENNYGGVHIRWYGGEPLLRPDLIEQIGKRIKQQTEAVNKRFSGKVVTNGVLLTDKTIQLLRSVNVDRLEISIDGPRELHDSLRPHQNGKSTYDKIMLATQKSAKHFETIILRVNVHTRNAMQIEGWLREIAPKIKKSNIYLKFNLVEGDSGNQLDWASFSAWTFRYSTLARVLGINLNGMRLTSKICHAICKNYFIIQSDLRVYKCPQNLGSNDHVGTISQEGNFQPSWRLNHWMDFTIENNDDCKSCALVPLCNGGCPYNQIMKEINPSSLKIYRRKEVCCREKVVPELLILRLF